MAEILSLVNTVSSTSIPVEIAHAVNCKTDSRVTIGALMQDHNVELDADIESMNLPVRFFSGRSNFDLSLYRKLRKHLQTHNYDVVHTHHNFSGSVARILGTTQGLSVISTEHNDLKHFTLPQRIVNAATYRFANIHIYNSYSTMTSRGPIERYLSPHDDVIYNGIDLDRVDESEGYELPVKVPDGTVVTNVGVMTSQKNQRAILKAASKIERNYPKKDIQFVLAGSGPLENDLRKVANELEIECVTFTGYLPEREHVYSLLHQSDLFLTPSVYEGFCVAAVEAMACSLPVIASDIDVFREVIGDDGIFVPYDDPGAIAQAILRAVSNDRKTTIRGKALNQRARTEFPLERTAKRYHKVYEQCAAE